MKCGKYKGHNNASPLNNMVRLQEENEDMTWRNSDYSWKYKWFSIKNDACSSYEKEVCSVQQVGKRYIKWMTRLSWVECKVWEGRGEKGKDLYTHTF